MRKILFSCFLAILAVLPATAQLQGDGSLANPYRGVLQGDFTISGTKYFNGNIYVDNETLTIAAGTTLIAVQMRASIYVTGYGKLLVSGTALSPVLLTCDTDLDGITGEPNDLWGNISIESYNSSQITYCTIERGRKDHVKFGMIGGGLRLTTSTVSVTNTTFLNCQAYRGGAIAVQNGAAPTISSCTFLNNIALEQGGAIYAETGTSPDISNCLFINNSSSSPTLKGGTIAALSGSPRLVNSTIAYSSSPAGDGSSLYLENSPGSIIVNNVIWGGTNHVGLNGTPASVLAWNAIEGASYAGNIVLNSSNTAPDGPNFANPSGGDFSITFVSPLRDSGTDAYPGVIIPTKDIIRTLRVHITDIGAYEARYSRWNGRFSNLWGFPKNWDANILPGTTNVVIPAGMPNYPTASPGPSFTLNSGLSMVMEPGSRATFTSLTNNGTIEIRADATGMASLMTGSYSGAAGSMNVEMHLAGATPEIDRWHYIAAPVTVPKTVFTDIEPDNLMSYDESKVVTDVIEGWQWHDGYDGTTPFSNLEARKGYNALVFEDVSIIFRNLKSLTTSMGQINLPFSGSGGDTSLYGYALIGNSLTCGINWDLVTRSDPDYVRNAIYITKDNTVASYVNGVGTNGGSAHIPPLQGFFVKTRATGTYITIPDNAREHNYTARYKSSQIIPLVRLTLESDKSADETVIRLEASATTAFDNEYDAGKIFSPADKRALIWSETGGEPYSINSIPWPVSQTVIPLTIKTNEPGTYTIRRSQLQGTGNTKVILYDALTATSTDLIASSQYSFTAPAGKTVNRFSVIITASAPTFEDNKSPEGSLMIYSSSGKVCVMPQGTGWDGVRGTVRMFDLTGRLILNINNASFNQGELYEYAPDVPDGLVIVEVTAGGKRYSEKIILTRE